MTFWGTRQTHLWESSSGRDKAWSSVTANTVCPILPSRLYLEPCIFFVTADFCTFATPSFRTFVQPEVCANDTALEFKNPFDYQFERSMKSATHHPKGNRYGSEMLSRSTMSTTSNNNSSARQGGLSLYDAHAINASDAKSITNAKFVWRQGRPPVGHDFLDEDLVIEMEKPDNYYTQDEPTQRLWKRSKLSRPTVTTRLREAVGPYWIGLGFADIILVWLQVRYGEGLFVFVDDPLAEDQLVSERLRVANIYALFELRESGAWTGVEEQFKKSKWKLAALLERARLNPALRDAAGNGDIGDLLVFPKESNSLFIQPPSLRLV